MKKLLVIAGVFLYLLTFVAPPVLFAQTKSVSPTPASSLLPIPTGNPPGGLNVTLSPTYITLVTDPGKEVSSQFKVTNNNSFTENLQVTVAKLTVGANGQPDLAAMGPSDSFAKWLNLQDTQFSLDANQSKTIPFSLKVPSDAGLGYYYTLLVHRVQNTNQPGNAVVQGSAGITVLLDVRSPNAKRELQVTSLQTDKLIYEYLPVTFNVTVKNTGNVHVVPFGDIFLDSMLHKEIGTVHVNPGRGNVLPGATRVFSVVWDDGFAVNQPKVENGVAIKDAGGRAVQQTNFDFSKANKFRIGKYTAHLLLVYDNGERDIPVEATVSFWVIPWKIIGGAILIILAPALIVYFLMRLAYRKKK